MSEYKRYIVKRTYKYTEEVEIYADSKESAEQLASSCDGERNHDDWLYDVEVYEPVGVGK